MVGGPAKNVTSAVPGQKIYVYIERRPDVTPERFDVVTRNIGAADVEELVPGILSARVDSKHLDALKSVAEVSVMDEKSPKR